MISTRTKAALAAGQPVPKRGWEPSDELLSVFTWPCFSEGSVRYGSEALVQLARIPVHEDTTTRAPCRTVAPLGEQNLAPGGRNAPTPHQRAYDTRASASHKRIAILFIRHEPFTSLVVAVPAMCVAALRSGRSHRGDQQDCGVIRRNSHQVPGYTRWSGRGSVDQLQHPGAALKSSPLEAPLKHPVVPVMRGQRRTIERASHFAVAATMYHRWLRLLVLASQTFATSGNLI